MTLATIFRRRLAAQRLTGDQPATPADVLAQLGAMQSQDYGMSLWAVALRLKKSRYSQVSQAVDRGEVLRTHVLRPTWHLVRAADIHWMLRLTAPGIRAKMAFHERSLKLNGQLFLRCKRHIEKALAAQGHLPRTELVSILQKGGIATDDNRASHILMDAELDGLICNGPRPGTYALLDERVPAKGRWTPDEPLAELTRRYFNGHGPATVYDFGWWSGLSITDCKKGIAMLGTALQPVKLGEIQYWSMADHTVLPKTPAALLLPAFDEWIVGYADRTGLFATEHEKKIITNNGIFRPLILSGGQAAGTWKPAATRGPAAAIIQKEFFHPISDAAQRAISAAEKKYAAFLSH